MQRIVLVGRHTPVLPQDIHVVKQLSISWSADTQHLERQWNGLKNEAHRLNAAIVLQNIPTVLFIALHHDIRNAGSNPINVGLIVMEATSRVDSSTVEFKTKKRCWHCSQWNTFSAETVDVATFCDPNHVHEIAPDRTSVKITVEPKTKLVFNRIDWF